MSSFFKQVYISLGLPGDLGIMSRMFIRGMEFEIMLTCLPSPIGLPGDNVIMSRMFIRGMEKEIMLTCHPSPNKDTSDFVYLEIML